MIRKACLLILVFSLGLAVISCERQDEVTPFEPQTDSLQPRDKDGTEFLDDATIDLAAGSGIVAAGVGLAGDPSVVQPGTIMIDVPGTPVQGIIYWEGQNATEGGDDEITVNGTPVTGDMVGGSTLFFPDAPDAWSSTYRADITTVVNWSSGLNSVEVGGMDFTRCTSGNNCRNNGAGILVIYDDGSDASEIVLKDGNDLAFFEFDPPLDTTDPVTFDFTAASSARTATLAMFAGSIADNRPNVVEITIGTDVTRLIDVFSDTDGPEWDTVMLDVDIPAGATSITVQALSEKDPSSPLDGDPASFAWVTAALSVPPQECASLGDFVWHDLNVNGIQDDNEPGIEGVTVNLWDCPPTEILDSRTTDPDGEYLFECLEPGDYVVQFVAQDGYLFSPRDQGNDDAEDSDPDPATGLTDCVTLEAGETDLTVDAGLYQPDTPLSCRVTGGSNGTFEVPEEGINEFSGSGQAGAPTASQPQPWGNWTHSQKKGPAGNFTFHAGTPSAPDGTEIDWIECMDPGWCRQARPAPAKQIDFGGVGTFKNMKDAPDEIADFVTVGESLHWFEVNIDDLGEPGGGEDEENCHPMGFGRNGGPEEALCGCPDFYRIQIHAGPDDTYDVIYEVYGYIDHGNYQIHPPTGHDN